MSCYTLCKILYFKLLAHILNFKSSSTINTREFVILENKRLIHLPDLTADFGFKTNPE